MVVDFEEALAILAQEATGFVASGSETVPLLGSLNRVLAQPVAADRDQPPFERSTRDGYAVRAQWLQGGPLRVVGEVRAGEVWGGQSVSAGEAVQVMTGAPLPPGTDAVAMVEHTSHQGKDGWLWLQEGRSLRAGENVVARGSEAHAGDVVVEAGARVGAAEIALAAACGYAELLVFRRPRVAVVATGDELVEVAETPQPQQIRNSNSYALAALVELGGGEAERVEIARDTLSDLRDRVSRGRRADLLVFSGGVSMGEYDLVEEVLAEYGAEFLFTGVKMQPGRPVVFGRLPERHGARATYFFGLPGNPISTQVTFHCFVERFLRTLGGESRAEPRWAQASLAEDVAAKAGLTRLLPAIMQGVQLRLVSWQGSGDLAANARANCYAELLPGRAYSAGEIVRVLLR